MLTAAVVLLTVFVVAGFTLIELLVVIVILGSLVGLAVLSMGSSSSSSSSLWVATFFKSENASTRAFCLVPRALG